MITQPLDCEAVELDVQEIANVEVIFYLLLLLDHPTHWTFFLIYVSGFFFTDIVMLRLDAE